MPYDFHNKLYSEGPAGFVDFVWLWYNRISIVICLAILAIAIVLAVLTALAPKKEGYVNHRKYKRKM